jgi:hypothetical protein
MSKRKGHAKKKGERGTQRRSEKGALKEEAKKGHTKKKRERSTQRRSEKGAHKEEARKGHTKEKRETLSFGGRQSTICYMFSRICQLVLLIGSISK